MEDSLRRAIAAATREHGQRAAISRQLGHPRGWLSEYVTGKVKHLKLDELAQLLAVVQVDGSQLQQLRAVMEVGERDAETIRLFRLWNDIAPEHRPAALHEVARVSSLSAEIRRLTAEVHRAAPGSPGARGEVPTPAGEVQRPTPRRRDGNGGGD